MMLVLLWFSAGAVLLFFVYAAVVSHNEGVPRARSLFGVAGLVGALLFLVPVVLPSGLAAPVGWAGLGVFYGMLAWFFVPRRRALGDRVRPQGQIDERTTMFSRRVLQPGSARYEEYYAQHPGHKPADDAFRKLPGLLSPRAAMYEPLAFEAAEAHFALIETMRPWVDGEPAKQAKAVPATELSHRLKALARANGAHSAGITELRPYHLYNYRGRSHNYGEAVNNTHRFALALTVRMGHQAVQKAPAAPVVEESSRQYVRSGVIALELARFLRNLGYPARAHIDGEYEVVCPLVARDAGLGEIGRMGLLMTPRLGPRVRIAVVTTDAPLVPDTYRPDPSVAAFCRICKLCASACPSRAIPYDGPRKIRGVQRWQINQEACFTYWCRAGTDCARCMAVCPYSHPDNPLHQIVRYGIRNTASFRYWALKMERMFYK